MPGWLRNLLDRRRGTRIPPESGAGDDPAVASTRRTGGSSGHDGGDNSGTTGPGESGNFVGRVAGQDEGYAGLTGAEARADPPRAATEPL
ncbi:hypothetical protein CFN78_21385 [Amycolatopsis antarctica]|uniref:Uncharacterized protein n=1 Tax=Amycolatopsis antarctica TaxID=1854586 RepID=A0A263CZE6_9PSEU|nr:hypothetical protein [Amycolatopsis antarctica]OZM71339.1 hypothetical protein CFN78_21385 [Amycolatopsis antarctica]